MKKALLVVLVLLLLFIGAVAAVLYSEAGLRWGFRQLQSLAPGELTVQRIEGRLAGPLEIEGLRYEDGATTIAGERLALDWHPARLLAGRVHIEELEATGWDISLGQSAAPAGDGTGLTLPLQVHIVEARARAVRVRPASGDPFVIDRLDIAASAEARHITLEKFHLEGPLGSVNASGRIPLHKGGALQVQTEWRAALEGYRLSGRGTVSGTPARIELEQQLTRPIGARVTARIDTDAQPVHWRIDAEAEPFALARLIPQPHPVRISHARLRARGKGAAVRADGSFDMATGDYGAWSATLTGEWDGSTWRIPAFTLEALEAEARMAGSAAQRTARDAAGPADYHLEVEWNELAWPPTGEPQVMSPGGSARLTGRPDDYRLRTDTELHYTGLPPAILQLGGHGDLSGLELDELRMRWLDGEWHGRGSLAWDGAPQWRLRLKASDIDPATLRPGLDGRLDAALELNGRGTGADFRLDGELDQLGGSLRTRPVSGGARFALDAGGVTIRNLELRTGSAALRGEARLGARWDIGWRLDAPDLSALHPELSGKLRSRGEASGKPRALRIDATLEAGALAYRQNRVDALRAEARIDPDGDRPWRIDIQADHILAFGRALGRLSIRGKGTAASHTIQLLLAGDSHRYEQTVAGSFTGGQWQGRLRDGAAEHRRIGRWSQSEQATVALAPSSAELGELCWRLGQSRVCVDGRWRGGGDGHINLTWQEIDLRLIQPWLAPHRIGVAGASNGGLVVTLAGSRPAGGLLAVAVEDGRVEYPLAPPDEPHSVAFERATLAVAAGPAEGLRADGEIRLSATEGLSARLALPDWDPGLAGPDRSQALEADLALRLRDLGAVTFFLPELVADGGRLDADLHASGTLAAPRVKGTAGLELAELAVARLGITLRDLAVQAQVERKRWRLQGAARSGTGRLEIDGHGGVPDLRHWDGRLELTGTEFQALRLPSAEVVASPELTFNIAPGGVEFGGSLRIPTARLEPQLNGQGVSASKDVVIEGGEEITTGPAPRRIAHGNLELILGDKVKIEGQGFEGRLTGRLQITLDLQGDATARGRLEIVDGRYEAYGQKLKISRGRLLYSGGAIDNPAIDITAMRTKGEVEVGIRVTGTAERPVLELFSDPAMDDTDILSYLIFGRPLNQTGADDGRLLYQAATSVALIGGEALAERFATKFDLEEARIESGEEMEDAALVLGKSLSPRLYIRYIQGLIDNASAFQVRYQLSDKWTLETESGTRGAGADLLFTLEK